MVPLKHEFQQMTRAQIEAHLLERARTEPAFRQAMLTCPRRTLEEALGLALPPGFQVRIVEESPACLYLVLPPPLGELSDLELEAVAGGKTQP